MSPAAKVSGLPLATPVWPGKRIAAQLFSAVATPATPKREHLQNCAVRVALLLPLPRLYCLLFLTLLI